MIQKRPFGTLPDGTNVTCYRLSRGSAYADVLDFGATLHSLVIPDRGGKPVDVVLGYDTAAEYLAGDKCFGALVGRHANRIGGGTFTLNGTVYTLPRNDGPNNLHSGPNFYHHRMYDAEISGDSLRLRLISPEGDQGFPGTLEVTFIYRFTGEKTMNIQMEAVSDRDTLVNFTGHSYFDLSGGIAPMAQLLRLDADSFCENDENTLPTGTLLSVEHTPFDFRREKPVGRDLSQPSEQLLRCGGYDHNYVLKNGGLLAPCAWLRSEETGIAMELSTDLPGLQLYSGNYTGGRGKQVTQYPDRAGVCLEPQFFPNAMAITGFPKPILRAGETYAHVIQYRFF